MPSRNASTWPRIAVNGVRSSCDTLIRKFRSCAPRRPGATPSRGTGPPSASISPRPRHRGARRRSWPRVDLVGRRDSASTGRVMRREGTTEQPGDDEAADDASPRRSASGSNRWLLRLRRRDDQGAERRAFPARGASAAGRPGRCRLKPGGRNSNCALSRPFSSRPCPPAAAEARAPDRGERSGRRGALVAGRSLELWRREPQRSSVPCRSRRSPAAGTRRGRPVRLAPKLASSC